jgi:O-antigen/teichoic acid export membrane protein
MYGMVIGLLLSGFVGGLCQLAIGSYFLGKVLKQYGMRVRDLYGMKVSRDVWVTTVRFAMNFWPGTIFSSFMGFFNFLIYVENLPGYTTILGLLSMANSLARFAGWSSGVINQSTQVFSESFNNGKHNLTRYYIASGLKYWSFFWFFLGPLNIFLMPIILQVVVQGGILNSQWLGIGPMVPVYVLIGLWSPFSSVANSIITISNNPRISVWMGIVSTIMNLFFTWYFLAVLQLGWLGMLLSSAPSSFLSFIVYMFYMHYKLLPLPWSFWKDIGWQVFVAPIIAGAIFTIFGLIILNIIWPIVSSGVHGFAIIGAAAATIAILVGGMLFIYIPLYSWFGGWDEHTMRDQRKSVPLTGFSLFITLPMYRLFDFFYRKSPFKERAKMHIGDLAFAELIEMGRERTSHLAGAAQ